VPEFISSNIKGESGEELMFHQFLTELHHAGQLGKGQADARVCADSLASAIRGAQSHALAEYASVAVSERVVLFASVGVPLYYREVRGLTESREKPLFAGHRPKPIEHPSFKAFMVVECDESPGDSWTAAPDGQVGWVGRDWKLRFRPVADEA
jgi:hypothetical protein